MIPWLHYSLNISKDSENLSLPWDLTRLTSTDIFSIQRNYATFKTILENSSCNAFQLETQCFECLEVSMSKHMG